MIPSTSDSNYVSPLERLIVRQQHKMIKMLRKILDAQDCLSDRVSCVEGLMGLSEEDIPESGEVTNLNVIPFRNKKASDVSSGGAF